MKKANKKDAVNLFFSAFLILAFIVCAHFFTQFTNTLPSMAGSVVSILIFAIFGLLLFYATRVGDGKAVKRFSLITLILMVIVPLYIIIASIAPGMPLNSVFAQESGLSVIVTLACIALGYGIPYSFLSGYEEAGADEDEPEPTSTVIEGGIEADLKEVEEDTNENVEESQATQEDTNSEEAVENTEETEENK